MKRKIMINSSKQKHLAYFDKLILKKNSDIDTITIALASFYHPNYIKTNLTFLNHPIYINHVVINSLSAKYCGLVEQQSPLCVTDFNNFLDNEIYNTIHVEHESSSRKAIKSIIKNTFNPDSKHQYLLEKNLLQAYRYILNKPDFNQNNIHTLYSLLTTDIEMGNNKLDGQFYRLSGVSIGKYQGIDAALIEKHMNALINYFNDGDDDDFMLKGLSIHTLFEIIHPYYDFNGRMGRLILIWYAQKINRLKYFLFFSTAVAHYRDQYIKIFSETQKLQMVDLTYPVGEMLQIMLANKQNYAIVQKIKQTTLDCFKTDLSYLAKDMLMRVLAIRDIYNHQTDTWIDKSTIDVYYQEYADSVIYNELHKLKQLKVIEVSRSKPLKVKFLISKFK